jgi:hypothetical protein
LSDYALNIGLWLTDCFGLCFFWKLSNGAGQGMEIDMKKLTIFLVFLFTLFGCATKGNTPSDDSELKPDVFCEVIQKPVPLLMGTWECSFTRAIGTAKADINYVKYQLIKYDDKYGLYFYRTWRSGKKKKKEWKNWTINGQEILGEPQFGVKISLQGGDVYFIIRGLEEPVKMSRVKD